MSPTRVDSVRRRLDLDAARREAYATWLVIAAYAQLRLARPLATDLRRPWEKPTDPNKLTPARVRRGFRNLRAKTGRLSLNCCPAVVKSLFWPCGRRVC